MIPYKENVCYYAWCYISYIKYTILDCLIFLATRTLKSFIKVSESMHDK